MARPSGANLSEGERVVYGDRALALKLAGATYEEITDEVPVHKNSLRSLILDASRRRAQDRDITEEINMGIAVQRQLIEDLLRDFRSIGSGTPQRANARAKLASQIVRAQMNLLFLSGVEVPDPEKIIMDALVDVPMPEIPGFLSYPEVHHIPELAPNPRATHGDPPPNLSGTRDDPEDDEDYFSAYNPDY